MISIVLRTIFVNKKPTLKIGQYYDQSVQPMGVGGIKM
jgi:hypothetical protein